MEGDLVLKKEKVYVPKYRKLRMEIIQLYYDMLAVEYKERWKTSELVIRNYWWPEITRDVGKYVNGYNMC